MKKITINVNDYLRNGIEDELQDIEDNEDIVFTDSAKREEFITDLLEDMLEQFENDMYYYDRYEPNFTDAVDDKIKWDSDYYGIKTNNGDDE